MMDFTEQDRRHFIKCYKQQLRQLELDYKQGKKYLSDHPNEYKARCTALLRLMADIKGKPHAQAITDNNTGRAICFYGEAYYALAILSPNMRPFSLASEG